MRRSKAGTEPKCTCVACTHGTAAVPPSCRLAVWVGVKLTALAGLGTGASCACKVNSGCTPKADKSRLTTLVICRGRSPSSIRHPGYHVGYGLACVRGRKKPPLRQLLLPVITGWLAGWLGE